MSTYFSVWSWVWLTLGLVFWINPLDVDHSTLYFLTAIIIHHIYWVAGKLEGKINNG